MAQSTVQHPPAGLADPGAQQAERPAGAGGLLRRYPEGAVAVLVLALATAMVVWARTRPGFDPYGWLVWGHQTLAGALNTNAAPSWKPLPFLFTLPYALFGHYQLWLWMITAVAVSLSGVFFAGRITYRVVLAGAPERRGAAWAAAVFAALALLGIADYWHYILSFQSDPVIVSLCLGAIDCHLSERPRWAFALGVLGALGRPEVWPFLALYTLWAWRARPAMRRLLAGGWAFVLFMWFGIPGLTSRTPFVAASNAFGSGRAPHGNKVFATVGRFVRMNHPLLDVAGLAGAALALVRRDRLSLWLAGGVVVWVAVEAAFALHGWPGLQRYMFPAGALLVVLAGIAIGRLVAEVRVGRWPWAGAALAGLIVVALIPSAISHARSERRDLHAQRARTAQINRLASAIRFSGGAARLRTCGEPLTHLEFQTILAWTLRMNVAKIGWKYGPAIARQRPIVLFTPTPRGGWVVQALYQHRASCRRL